MMVYIIGGMLYQRIVKGAKGMEQFPNIAFWRDFGNLQAVSILVDLCYMLYINSRGTMYTKQKRQASLHLKNNKTAGIYDVLIVQLNNLGPKTHK